jgi:hypothetical protein
VTDRRRLRATTRTAGRLEEPRWAEAARVLPLGGVASLAVSPDVVRAKLGAWSGLRAPEERPDLDAAWREVLLVLEALVEAGAAALTAEAVPAWERDVPVPREPLDLQQRTALSRNAVRRAVDRAISAELLDLQRRVGDELLVRVRPEVFADAPVVAAVDWVAVRRALDVQVSPVALLLVREIARRTTPERRAHDELVPISLREFGAATGASKGTIQKTLGVLQATALVESHIRDRVDSWHRLLPTVFGADPASGGFREDVAGGAGAVVGTGAPLPGRASVPGAEALTASPVALREPMRRRDEENTAAMTLSALATRPADAASVTAAVSAAGPAVAVPATTSAHVAISGVVYEVAGIRWPLPPGVQPRLERGPDGAPMRRLGNVRLPMHAAADPDAFPIVEIDGVRWEILPDARPQLEREPDGSYWYRVGGERWPFRPF